MDMGDDNPHTGMDAGIFQWSGKEEVLDVHPSSDERIDKRHDVTLPGVWTHLEMKSIDNGSQSGLKVSQVDGIQNDNILMVTVTHSRRYSMATHKYYTHLC